MQDKLFFFKFFFFVGGRNAARFLETFAFLARALHLVIIKYVDSILTTKNTIAHTASQQRRVSAGKASFAFWIDIQYVAYTQYYKFNQFFSSYTVE
jgi:hypothetical protein